MTSQALELLNTDAVEDTARVLRCLGPPLRLQVRGLVEQ